MRGKAIWILSFFTFLSALNSITAIILAINLGIMANFQPYLISSLTGAIPIYVYLIVSILATLVFLLATSSKVVSELSDRELLYEINQRSELLQDGQALLKANQDELKGTVLLVKQNIDQTQKQITHNFSEQEKHLEEIQAELTRNIEYESTNITSRIRKNLTQGFSKQEENLTQLHDSLAKGFKTQLADAKVQIGKQIQKLENNIQKSEKRAKKNEKMLIKQENEILDIKDKITQLEEKIVKPKAQLTSQSSPEEIRGIGPNTNNELKEMGITNVGELILTDPQIIAEKTSASENMAKKLQVIAQLSMIPSLKERDINLLEEIGITNQQELANQDPIEIGRKINEILKAQIESGKIPETTKPTIEEIQSWIKFAKT
jgi:predicted flap endonuclease-1-like 5' DNA nuclease